MEDHSSVLMEKVKKSNPVKWESSVQESVFSSGKELLHEKKISIQIIVLGLLLFLANISGFLFSKNRLIHDFQVPAFFLSGWLLIKGILVNFKSQEHFSRITNNYFSGNTAKIIFSSERQRLSSRKNNLVKEQTMLFLFFAASLLLLHVNQFLPAYKYYIDGIISCCAMAIIINSYLIFLANAAVKKNEEKGAAIISRINHEIV